ncbi:MAG: SseB family protein [Bdellovibrionales bacterium]|nr:SseB family protein [Bdellovibrionales bacterium]
MTIKKLESLIAEAFHGDKISAKEFFQEFLGYNLLVPLRHQKLKLSNSPDYPNDFISVLGVKEKETSFVPVFSNAEYIFEWCGQNLEFKELSGKQIIDIVPENWWLVLNPGREFEKEFSPWEIEKLKQGSENIPEIIEDIFSDEDDLEFEILPVDSIEVEELKKQLISFSKKEKSIEQIACVIEKVNQEEERILFSITLSDDFNLEIKNQITSIIEQALIGGKNHRIVFDTLSNRSLAVGFIRSEHIFFKKA